MALKVILNLPRTIQREGSSGGLQGLGVIPCPSFCSENGDSHQRPQTCGWEPCVQPLRGPPSLSVREVSALSY